MRINAVFAVAVVFQVSLTGFPPAPVSAAEPPAADAERAPTVYTQWPFDANEAKRRQKETADKLGLTVDKAIDLGGGVKLELTLIPAGGFEMGAEEAPEEIARKCQVHVDPGWFKSEQPRHLVRVSKPFWMGKHEVAQDAWEKVMGNNPSKFKGARNPVDQVSWSDCQHFLKNLNALGKDKGAFRLPTEAEWEYACRAGTKTAFFFGETVSTEQANYDGTYGYGAGRKGEYRRKSMAVGSFPANAWGLYDMHGNAWEWCDDWWGEGYYAKSPKEDPAGPEAGLLRVLRGGAWVNSPGNCRSANRDRREPTNRSEWTGLRVALTVATP